MPNSKNGLINKPVIRASLWSVGGFAIGQALRLVGNLAMTRLLFPEAFGLMAIVTILLIGLEMFTDLGITTSLIQNKRGEEAAFINTAWTIKVIRGVLIFAGICILASPIADFYSEPQFVEIVPVMALTALINGFASNAPALANRKLWVGRITVLNLGSQAISIAVTLVWAWFSPTVWALVAGNVLNALFTATLSHAIFPSWHVKFQWDRRAAHELIRFGIWMFITSILAFLASQLDRIVLARLVPFELVGIYSIGFMWATLPLHAIQTWIGRVFFPLAADILRKQNFHRKTPTTYRRRAVWLCIPSVGLFGGLITPIYRLLYSPEYWPATQFLEIILFGVVIRILDEPYRAYNLALGQPKYTSIGAAISVALFAITVYPLFGRYGAHGIALSYSISQIGTLAASLYGVRKAELIDLRTDAAAIFACGVIWATLYFLTRDFIGNPS